MYSSKSTTNILELVKQTVINCPVCLMKAFTLQGMTILDSQLILVTDGYGSNPLSGPQLKDAQGTKSQWPEEEPARNQPRPEFFEIDTGQASIGVFNGLEMSGQRHPKGNNSCVFKTPALPKPMRRPWKSPRRRKPEMAHRSLQPTCPASCSLALGIIYGEAWAFKQWMFTAMPA